MNIIIENLEGGGWWLMCATAEIINSLISNAEFEGPLYKQTVVGMR